MKKILAVFAHPDDEAFGPGGTLAKYANDGVIIHLLCATRGERGEWNEKSNIQYSKSKKKEIKIQRIREKELLRSAEILGIQKTEFLDFIDGQLGNAIYHQLAEKIISKIKSFAPQVLLTYNRLGVSGHLDHIAISMITTYSFQKTKIPQKLYYYCFPNKWYDKNFLKYFIYFPEGEKDRDITTKIDYSRYWEIKRKAMMQHKSQMKDVENLLKRYSKWSKTDHYILQFCRGIKTKFPETDLFSGIK